MRELSSGGARVDFQGGFTHGALVVECLEPGDPEHTLAEAKKARKFLEDLTR